METLVCFFSKRRIKWSIPPSYTVAKQELCWLSTSFVSIQCWEFMQLNKYDMKLEWRASHQNQIRILLPHRQKHISACCLAAIAAGSGRHIIYFLFLASKVFIITFQFNFNLLFVTSWPLTYFLVSKQTLCHSLGFKCVTFHFLSLSVSPSFFCVHQWLIGKSLPVYSSLCFPLTLRWYVCLTNTLLVCFCREFGYLLFDYSQMR